MKKPAVIVASVVAIFGAFISMAAIDPHSKSEKKLTGKYLIVCSKADCFGVVQNVSLEKLGDREFLVFPWNERTAGSTIIGYRLSQ